MTNEEYLRSISTSFQHSSQVSIWTVALILGGIAFLFFSLFFIQSNRWYIRAKYLYLKKMWKGELVSKDRVRSQLEIILQLPYRERPERSLALNVSSNGMFVKMNPPLPVGENFKFILNLNDKEKVSAWAEVRWSNGKRTPYTAPGIGCKFFNMSDPDRQTIQRFLRKKK